MLTYALPASLLLWIPIVSLASFGLSFQGLVQILNTGGIILSAPAGTVVDPSGNIYFTDTGNHQIVEVNARGTASVLTITGLSPALVSPTGIAIDGSGNLYITDADPSNSRVVKVSPLGAASIISTGSVTLISPKGVALDQSGDIFIADTGNNRIVEVTSGGSAAALTINGLSSPPTLHTPIGLAVDVSGNLYIADSVNNRVVKLAAGTTTGAAVSILGGVTLNTPKGVAVDRIGNVFIADTGNSRIAEVDTASNGTVLYTDSAELNAPLGVALDVFGTVYIADTGNNRGLIVAPPVNANLTSSNPTYSLNKSAVGFGHLQLGSASAVTLTLPFTIGTTAFGSAKVFTSGIQNLDFTMTGTTCIAGATSVFCTVTVNYLPTAPGLRTGAVVLYDNATPQNPLLTIPLYAFSDSPVAALAPNIGSVINAGGLTLSNPYQLAFDGVGNLYVGNYSGMNVTKIAAGGGSASLVNLGTPGGIAHQDITGLALDGAGNLFIGDHQNSRILVVTPGGVVSVLSITGLSPVLGFPTTLAFDGAGNLFVADFTNGRIVELSTVVVAGTASSAKATVIGTGSFSFAGSTLTGVTVDSMGNVYAAARTQNSSSIVKVTAAGVASLLAIPNNITPAINNPQGVGVDGMGNLYVVDTGNNRIVEITTAGVASILNISGLTSPATLGALLFGVTVDPSGNLYIPDWTNSRIVFVNVSGAVLSFATTKQGLTSSDSPKTATVTNLGNQPLVFSTNPAYTPNFSDNSSGTDACTSSTSLSSGTVCDVSVNFTPQSVGSLSASITVTDNTRNVAASTQQTSATGTGLTAGDTTAVAVSTNPATTANLQQPLTVTAVITDTTAGHTSTVPTGSVNFSDTVGSTTVMLNGGNPVAIVAGIATLTGATLTGLGSHTITAAYGGVSDSFLPGVNTTSLTVNKDTGAISGPATQPIPITAGQSGSVVITVTKPYTAAAAPSGSITYTIFNSSNTSVASGSPLLTAGAASSTATVPVLSSLAPGTYTLTVSYSGDANYAASTAPITIQLTVGLIAPTVGLTSSVNPALAKSAIAFTATVSSSSGTPTGSVNFYDGTTLLGAATLAQGVAIYTTSTLAAGSHSITAAYGGDSSFSSLTSSALAETVQDFSLSVSTGGSASATASPGGTATYSLKIGPSSGSTFPGALTLAVTGLPAGATAALTPSTLPAGSGPTNVTFTIQVPAQTAALSPGDLHAFQLSPVFKLSSIMLGILLLPFGGSIRRTLGKRGRMPYLLLLVFSGISLLALAGCASKNSGYFGSPQTSYILTVTATSGALSHSTTLTLTVN